MPFDFKDTYIGYPGHPKFISDKIIEDNVVRVIIQKLEMVLFTNKGELFGDPDFGCDLEILLHQTKIPAVNVERIIIEQIQRYIPELNNASYTIEVNFYENPNDFQDVMKIDFQFGDNYFTTVFA